jgi:hypothetical protein
MKRDYLKHLGLTTQTIKMDNREIDIQSEGEYDFKLAMQLATANNKKAVGYSLELEGSTMVLYWSKHEKMIPLPYSMDSAEITSFVWGWLQKTKPLGARPDHDGDNGEGFRVYNEAWGHVFHRWEAFIAITPIWAMYGK